MPETTDTGPYVVGVGASAFVCRPGAITTAPSTETIKAHSGGTAEKNPVTDGLHLVVCARATSVVCMPITRKNTDPDCIGRCTDDFREATAAGETSAKPEMERP
ncbi:hypothetical protein [Citrifermentans bemidjiense]|nr:hypothetical protein [Citrifermentans bemidjiense]